MYIAMELTESYVYGGSIKKFHAPFTQVEKLKCFFPPMYWVCHGPLCIPCSSALVASSGVQRRAGPCRRLSSRHSLSSLARAAGFVAVATLLDNNAFSCLRLCASGLDMYGITVVPWPAVIISASSACASGIVLASGCLFLEDLL